ncbi:uncharacterized protein LOC128751746 isoform X1 [Synchiropus splendidus]|uniref:uncharacterized protein LOC128751746 isoform X1 n=1 Tax=Synchiropus splendidus TaxID=270530 RepID=UPI00237DFB22|nr:uncharacterized protein LOC128751746 isoform X1 [Synchiropus splendidus]
MSVRRVSLLVILLIYTAATEQAFLSVLEGVEVTLPCNSLMPGHVSCDGNDWLLDGETFTVLVSRGSVIVDVDRLSVTPDCSLVIKAVKTGDVGSYYCNHSLSNRNSPEVYLSVVTMTRLETPYDTTLTCQVFTYWNCVEKVQWHVQGQHVLDGHPGLETTLSSCKAVVHFPSSSFLKKKTFTCQVSDDKRTQEFSFITAVPSDSSVVVYLMLTMHAAEILLVTVVIALLIRVIRNQRSHNNGPLRAHCVIE